MKAVGRYEAGLLAFVRANHADLLDWITKEDPKIKGDADDRIKAVVESFTKDFA